MMSPERAARSLLKLKESGYCAIDPEGMAVQISDVRIVHAPISVPGVMVTYPEYTALVIRSNLNNNRRRFTIAHEIGHVLYQRLRITSENEEVWCDLFASHLLIPTEYLVRFSQSASPIEWLTGPATFCVSREAFAIRSWEALGIGFFVARSDPNSERKTVEIFPRAAAKVIGHMMLLGSSEEGGNKDASNYIVARRRADLLGNWEGVIVPKYISALHSSVGNG